MELSFLDELHPRVVTMRIKRTVDLYGKWTDQEHVFTMIASGSAEFFVGGRLFLLKKGDCIVLPPQSAHIIASKSSEPLVQYIFHFDAYDSPQRAAPWGEQAFVFHTSDAERYDVRNAYLRMYKEYSEPRPGSQAMLSGLALTILVAYFRACGDQPVAQRRKDKAWIHIEQAVQYITQNMQTSLLSNENVAAAIHVSANYLTKLFQEHLGFSLHSYILNLRVERAKDLLYSEPITITEVAYRCGFSSIHVFSKTFRRIAGMSPSEFLENSVLKGSLLPPEESQSLPMPDDGGEETP